MPLLDDTGPLWALGSDPPRAVTDLASDEIIVPGFLEDVTARFDAGRVFVSPLRYGAGMKGKIGQAMALGLPVVTTSIGAEGMGLRHEVDVLIADEAGEFAEAVLRLCADDALWSTISANARRRATDEWQPVVMADRLRHLLDRAGVAGRLTPRAWQSSAPLYGDATGPGGSFQAGSMA
jgi:glycosyltransferase involved in cell wall biosynthesis